MKVPPEIRDAAEERASARAARDYATADRLRDEIEAAGWRVVDTGADYELEPAHPADLVIEGEIRYGRSDAVPSRLDEPPTGLASVILIVDPEDPLAINAAGAFARHLPGGADLVLVGDGIGDALALGLAEALQDSPVPADRREVIRTSARLGRAAALNAGIRRARGPIVVVEDTSVEVTGDVVTPLAEALGDPSVAVAGPFGLVTSDLRHFEEFVPAAGQAIEVAAVEGYLMAFRRVDAIHSGPLDEAFRFYRNLDIWWSLVLRDAGQGESPRRAVAVPDLPLIRRRPFAWTATAEPVRNRLSKRNFYRVLDRFRTRSDLAVSPPGP